MTASQALAKLDDEALIDQLQRAAFGYIKAYTEPTTGLVADTSRPGAPASIAVVGFALAAYPVAVERGWISRRAAARRVLTALEFFRDSAQGEEEDAAGYKGFYYHFLDMKTGARVWRCELSMIDSGLLFAGILTAQAYFDRKTETETAIRALADGLYRRADWDWARDGMETLAQGWKPDYGFLRADWEGYDEATLLYLLALGSPSHPPEHGCFSGWTVTYQWENLLGQDVLYCGPLFTHLFSHAFVDFRGLRDDFMREKDSDYFENTVRTVALHREYAVRNPLDFEGYDRDFWGITAGDGPQHPPIREAGRERRFFGYMSRGAPYGPDDGTISPWAMMATLPFTREAALLGTRALLRDHPWTCRRGRFVSGYNPTLRPHGGRGWLSDGWYGLDQGLLVLLIENARSGLIWELMRGCEVLVHGLRRAGFQGGWLSS